MCHVMRTVGRGHGRSFGTGDPVSSLLCCPERGEHALLRRIELSIISLRQTIPYHKYLTMPQKRYIMLVHIGTDGFHTAVLMLLYVARRRYIYVRFVCFLVWSFLPLQAGAVSGPPRRSFVCSTRILLVIAPYFHAPATIWHRRTVFGRFPHAAQLPLRPLSLRY